MKTKAKVLPYCCLIFLVVFPVMTATAATGPKTGIIIPLYTYPTDSSWASLIRMKHAYPAIPFVAIINPANGPGLRRDPVYVEGINDLKAAGIIVIGYIHTNYGAESLSILKKQMQKYKEWYAVSGIFFDEMGNSRNLLPYYKVLASEATTLQFTITVGNPGTAIDSNLVGVFSNICIYENPGMPSIGQISGYSSYGKDGFSFIAYSVSGLPSTLKNTTQYVAYLYVTNLGGSNPYNGLPSYLQNELTILSQ